MRGRTSKVEPGQRYGILTTIERTGSNENNKPLWLCVCDCGNTRIARGDYLLAGRAYSCGCSASRRCGKKTANGLRKMESKSRLYSIWRGMIRRCYDNKRKEYSHYGARGISVCEEWKTNFPAFKKWAEENGYQENLSIDRIEPTGNYEPDNCRWADIHTQNNNRRTNVYVDIDGERHTLKEWAKITGINYDRLKYRLKKGITGKDLIKRGE